MDISKTTAISQQVLSVAKPDGGAGSNKSVPGGNSLPALNKTILSVANQTDGASTQKPSPEQLRELVAKANETPIVRSSDLSFSVAEGADVNVVRIEDTETGELIRQIPSEEMVALARALSEQRQGMMVEERV
ncbi:MAG TPA: flagellar protein FlaG [Candidatus Tenderia electrophaga]|uniref:Flagellar protein FlaG n=1 Tax=Candidatus Tenderia electrophaga TaxID=1748243 RepID=A0A832J6C3_9GAMM|nr:flagellar protein FlaG [Candidatus Tenderia electrophaga]